MRVDRVAGRLQVHAPAKLNLLFEVLAKRDDGFHEIETLMCPVNLCDTLLFEDDPAGRVNLECAWAPGLLAQSAGLDGAAISLGVVPQGPENIVVRAVELMRARAAVNRGASLRLIKRIPSAAGLGGGSSDAAAALLLANEGWGLNWPRSELMKLAAELGSDVPFFLQGGPAICRGRGEQVQRVSGIESLHLVAVRPPAGLSTAAVYAACRAAVKPRRAEPLISALQAGDAAGGGRLVYNALQTAAESLSPWIERLRHVFSKLDCWGHQMSGSGTTYFGLCRHARHARRLAARLRGQNVGQVFALATL